MRIKFFTLPILLVFLCAAGPFQLSKRDVRRTAENMFNYHVEYKEFSPLLARRSLKLYIDQFDSERIYLLADEALPFLAPRNKTLKAVVSNYQRDDFSEYRALNQIIQKSIVRARHLRDECMAEILQADIDLKEILSETYPDFAKSEGELKERVYKHLIHILSKEKYLSSAHTWDEQRKKMTFDLWERRFHRVE